MEEAEARRCRARLEHLAELGLPQKGAATLWNDARMDRILADYMLRRGYHRSALQLGSERQIEVLPRPTSPGSLALLTGSMGRRSNAPRQDDGLLCVLLRQGQVTPLLCPLGLHLSAVELQILRS